MSTESQITKCGNIVIIKIVAVTSWFLHFGLFSHHQQKRYFWQFYFSILAMACLQLNGKLISILFWKHSLPENFVLGNSKFNFRFIHTHTLILLVTSFTNWLFTLCVRVPHSQLRYPEHIHLKYTSVDLPDAPTFFKSKSIWLSSKHSLQMLDTAP